MNKVGRFFTNPVVISLIGLTLVSLLIWFAGPYIKFGDANAAPLAGVTTRLIIIMVILVLWGLNNLRIQMQANKSNQGLVADLQQNNANSSVDLASEQAAEEIHVINERFTDALATLKKLKFKGNGKNKALYELPWYIIVGPPGSGKTTALVNSGLDFPLAEQFGKGSLQGVGGTRNCDWWFTNEAVLIDTAGRYTTQDSHRVLDSSAWVGFLDLLKRNRRRRPINGAIVAISLHDLLIQTEEDRMLNAKTIRMRLDELMERLEIRFPVYLLLTKTDLVAGFSEFFEDLSKEDRDQVWGISLPNAPQATQSPDFDFLQTELRNLSNRLHERVLWRMHQERDVKRCAAIQGFPLQMENLNSIIESFVKQTFVKNRYQYQPYLRGVYFSSGTQDGTPIDRLMSSVSANFGFSRDASHSPTQRGKSFFISRLFREVIFPESELVGSNARYEKMMRLTQHAAYIGLTVVTALMVLVWVGSVTRNKMYISEVAGYVSQFNDEAKRQPNWRGDIKTVLPAMAALENASNVYNQESHPWLTGLGLYESSVDEEADKSFALKLKTLFLPKVVESFEGVLRQGDANGDLYNTFRLYMMFKKLEHMDKPVVREWLVAYWDKTYRTDAATKDQLIKYLDQLFAGELPASALNDQVVAQTREILLRVPPAQRIYSRIKSRPEYNARVDLLNLYGETVRTTFKMDEKVRAALTIPVLYTLQGYKSLDLSVGSKLISDVGNDSWILSDDDGKSLNLANQDLKEVSEQVKELYFADYTRVWTDVYGNLSVNNFNSLHEVNDALTSFTDPAYSPIVSILQVGKTNTQLTPPIIENLADKNPNPDGAAGKALNFLATKVEGTVVDKRFHDLIGLVNESSRGPAPINMTLQRLQQVKEYVAEIALAPDPAKKSYEVAKARYQTGSANPITALRVYAQSLPEPVQQWLIAISDVAWRNVQGGSKGYVNAEWRAQVYTPYAQALAGKYPLNRAAADEVAIADFNAFFKPNGTLDTYVKEFILPFIETRGTWTNKSVDGNSIGLSSATLAQLQRAASIRDVFYKQNPESPTISLDLTPTNMSKDDARFTLEMGDQRLTYSHGPKFAHSLVWSGNNDSKRLRILFEDLKDASFDKTYNGAWAWFRLMDDSTIESTPQSNVYLITFGVTDSSKNVHKITYEGRANSVNNPFKNDLLGSFKCPESL